MPDKPTTHWLETNKPSLQQTQCDSPRSCTGARSPAHDTPHDKDAAGPNRSANAPKACNPI